MWLALLVIEFHVDFFAGALSLVLSRIVVSVGILEKLIWVLPDPVLGNRVFVQEGVVGSAGVLDY